MARLTSAQRRALPKSDFAGPKGSFPLNDTSHIRAAVREEKFASPATKARIDAAAREAGVMNASDASGFHPKHAAKSV